MKNFKQHLKLNKLQVKAEKCLSREEAKKILIKANKTQNKISKWDFIILNLDSSGIFLKSL